MNPNIYFDYKLSLSEIENCRKTNFNNLSFIELYSTLFEGNIYLFFNYNQSEEERKFIILKTGILDYLLQFDGVIDEIDNGNYNTFSVSSDYYSNSLQYIYSNQNDELKIHEVNDNLFTVNCKYSQFKSEYIKFRKNTLEELIFYFPELMNNIDFINHFIK
ncbi:MAG: hypothetical protein ACRC8Z_06400 [Empedobacter falsenii]